MPSPDATANNGTAAIGNSYFSKLDRRRHFIKKSSSSISSFSSSSSSSSSSNLPLRRRALRSFLSLSSVSAASDSVHLVAAGAGLNSNQPGEENSDHSWRSPLYNLLSSWITYLLFFTCAVCISFTFFLRSQVRQLEAEVTDLQLFCRRSGIVYDDNGEVLKPVDNDTFTFILNTSSRRIALCSVILMITAPFMLYKYLDFLLRTKNHSQRRENSKEEVPLKKRIAYKADVCFTRYPYAKLLALLFATIFLIGFGGLALYAVGDGSFTEAIWLSWTFVADSGSHADRVGTASRIVSMFISSGGMLIFAMMLGLVSDSISERVDSLRKGKSEVIESNHTLILGWSDKLVHL